MKRLLALLFSLFMVCSYTSCAPSEKADVQFDNIIVVIGYEGTETPENTVVFETCKAI